MARSRLRVLRFLGWSSLPPCPLSNSRFWAQGLRFLTNRKITMSHLRTPQEHLHFRQNEFYLSRMSPCIGGEFCFVAI